MKLASQEQLVREVKLFGNGAHVAVPKEWFGEMVVLVRTPKLSINERIMKVINPYLENIVGVYLYGSQARGEARADSDVDLLVITNKSIKIKEKCFEVLCIEEKNIDKSINLEPLLMYSALAEAKPIINSALLDNLKSMYKPEASDFKDFISSTRNILRVNEDSLSSKGEFFSGSAEVYSIVLRLRGLFIMNCLLGNKTFSNKSFKKWVSYNVKGVDFDKIYDFYRKAKLDIKIKEKINKNNLLSLLEFLKREINKK